MKATLTNYRQSPRKVRMVTAAVKGKRVADADAVLAHMPKRAALPVQKLIKSATVNAVAKGAKEEALIVKNIEVNKGLVMKRYMPRAMGVAKPIRKKMSHVTVTLEEKVAKESKAKKVSKKK